MWVFLGCTRDGIRRIRDARNRAREALPIYERHDHPHSHAIPAKQNDETI